MLSDVWELTVYGQILGQRNIITFAVKDVGESSIMTMFDWAEYVKATWLTTIANYVSDQVSYSSLKIVQNFSPTIFTEQSFTPVNGQITGDCLPPYATWSFKKSRSIIGVRPGGLHLAGVPESWQVDGVVTTDHSDEMAALASYLSGNYEFDSFDTQLVPVVVSKVLNGQPRDPFLVMTVNNIQFEGIGTQNTRKYGRGS